MAGLRAATWTRRGTTARKISDEMMDDRTSWPTRSASTSTGWAPKRTPGSSRRTSTLLPDRRHEVVADGEQVALFLDCSKSGDATGPLVGSRISATCSPGTAGLLWQKPHGWSGKGWLAPRSEVDATVRAELGALRRRLDRCRPVPGEGRRATTRSTGSDDRRVAPRLRPKLKVWATPARTSRDPVRFDMRLSQPAASEAKPVSSPRPPMAGARDRRRRRQRLTRARLGARRLALRLHAHNARRRPNQWGVSLGKVDPRLEQARRPRGLHGRRRDGSPARV
jgi:hypothetical protein